MNPLAVAGLAGLGAVGLITFVAWSRGNARRTSGRFTSRSVQAGLERARKGKKRTLVAFVSPDDATVFPILASDDGPLGRRLDAELELVRIDSSPEDLSVVSVVARKYGVERLTLPTLLLLDPQGKREGSLEGAAAFGEGPAHARERIAAFLRV